MTDRPHYVKLDKSAASSNFGIQSERKGEKPIARNIEGGDDRFKCPEIDEENNFMKNRIKKYQERTASVKRTKDPTGWEGRHRRLMLKQQFRIFSQVSLKKVERKSNSLGEEYSV